MKARESFLVVDVETANSDCSSVCEIAIIDFKDGIGREVFCTLIDPDTYFDGFNSSIHGISEEDVKGKRKFSDVAKEIHDIMSGKIVISHGSFDRTAFLRSFEKSRVSFPNCEWVDSTNLVRRTWKEFKSYGYGLDDLCNYLKINIEKHHRAFCDAKACGEIVLSVLRERNISVEDLSEYSKSKYESDKPRSLKRGVKFDGNSSGKYYNSNIVLTGTFSQFQLDIEIRAANLGFDVHENVTKKTKYLLVGDNSSERDGVSSKQKKALEYGTKTITEAEFNVLEFKVLKSGLT